MLEKRTPQFNRTYLMNPSFDDPPRPTHLSHLTIESGQVTLNL